MLDVVLIAASIQAVASAAARPSEHALNHAIRAHGATAVEPAGLVRARTAGWGGGTSPGHRRGITRRIVLRDRIGALLVVGGPVYAGQG
jgi:hypothetical protein